MIKILFYAPNHIGDSVMAIAAIRAFINKSQNPNSIFIICSPLVKIIWLQLVQESNIIVLEKEFKSTFATVKKLRSLKITTAFILAGSTRSALITFLSSISNRIGYQGDLKSLFLTSTLKEPLSPQYHKSKDYYYLIHKEYPEENLRPNLEPPTLSNLVPPFGKSVSPIIAIMPGAARGESKRWPVESFAQLAQDIIKNIPSSKIVILGSKEDFPLGSKIQSSTPPDSSYNLCGSTSIEEWISYIGRTNLVICNDSGGMHIADGLEVSLVAIFGITNPQKTGPLGIKSTVIQKSDIKNEKISSSSIDASIALKSISPKEVLKVCIQKLA